MHKLILIIFNLSLSFGTIPHLFKVKDVKESIRLIQNMTLVQKLTIDIKSKLKLWAGEVDENPLLFEDPVTNFLFLKMLLVDIQKVLNPEQQQSIRDASKMSFVKFWDLVQQRGRGIIGSPFPDW